MKLSRKTKILSVAVAVSLLLHTTVYADVFFTASGGLAADLLPKTDFAKTEVQISAFYAAQVQLGSNLLLNGAFSLRTENIFGNIFLQDIPSLFSLDEFSFLYRFTIEQSVGHIALFTGNYESAGTDTFVRRHFGVDEIQSNLLQNRIGQKPVSVFAIDGFGAALSTRFTKPTAVAFYVYYNEKFSDKHLNVDFRIAGATKYFIGDFVFGVSLPLDTTDENGEDVILIIRRADFHAGLTMLLGNNSSANMYMQFGIARVQINPEPGQQIVTLEDLYIFIEPRFAMGRLNFALSLFALPKETLDIVAYIDNSVGASFSMEATHIDMGNAYGTVGGLITASIPNPAIEPFDITNLSMQVVPFTEITIGQGLLNVSLHIYPLEYMNFNKMFAVSTSYKITL